MDDTTTLIFKRLDKVDKIAEDVHTIKSQMPHLATKDHVDLKIAAHAALPSKAPRPSGNVKKVVAISAAVVAIAGVIAACIQMI